MVRSLAPGWRDCAPLCVRRDVRVSRDATAGLGSPTATAGLERDGGGAMPGGHAHPPPEPIEQVIGRLKDEQQHLRRSSKRRARARPRSAAQLSKTPLASAWPEHAPRPRSAAAARAARNRSSELPGGRISASELRSGGPQERRAERKLQRDRLALYDVVGCVAHRTKEQKSFSCTAPPPRTELPPPSNARHAKAAARVAELLCRQTETRAVLRLQRCWRQRSARNAARQRRKTASVIRAVKLKIDKANLELSQLFRQLDADNSGSIDYSELRQGFARLGVPPLTDEEFDLFVQLVDRDGDGSIDRAEVAVLLEHNVLSSTDAFGAMSALRSIGGFRIEGLPQGFQEYEASFVPDPQHPTCLQGAAHYSNPNGCHLYLGKDGCWVLNHSFAPEQFMPIDGKGSGYMRKSVADQVVLLHGVTEWSPQFKRPTTWRWRIADRFYDVTLTFRYEAVVPSKKNRRVQQHPHQQQQQQQEQEQAASGGKGLNCSSGSGSCGGGGGGGGRRSEEASLVTSLYDESMALTRKPTGRACWQDREPRPQGPYIQQSQSQSQSPHNNMALQTVAASRKRRARGSSASASPAVGGSSSSSRMSRRRRRGEGQRARVRVEPHRLKAGGLPRPRQGKTDGPRGREGILLARRRGGGR